MEFIRLLPSVEGYSHKPSAGAVSAIEVDGGMDVRRAELVDVTTLFTVTYIVNQEDFAYLTAFFDAYFLEPTWFHALLVGMPKHGVYPLQRYAVQVIPGTYKLSSIRGHQFAVSMTLEGHLDEPETPTSTPYPVPTFETISSIIGMGDLNRLPLQPRYTETVEMTMGIVDNGTLRSPMVVYQLPHEDTIESEIGMGATGTLRQLLLGYDMPHEDTMSMELGMGSTGTLKVALIGYTNYTEETMDSSISIVSGTLV